MATRSQLRLSLRERIEDGGASPLWSDAALNAFLAGAVRAYGGHLPVEARSATAPVAAGVSSLALPAGVDPARIVRVLRPDGAAVARLAGGGPLAAGETLAEQAWWPWGGVVYLARAAAGPEVGVWLIDHVAGREVVADETSEQPIVAGDDGIVVALAAAAAVERRVVEDGKRGNARSGLAEVAAGFREEATKGLAARRRRARGGTLAPVGGGV